jgi:hypothetical protein
LLLPVRLVPLRLFELAFQLGGGTLALLEAYNVP